MPRKRVADPALRVSRSRVMEGGMISLFGTPRRIAVIGAALVLAATVFVTPVAAAKPTCLVENIASHTSFRSLQAAVQAAPSGAELRVKGTCVGNTTITKDLVIRGKSNPDSVSPRSTARAPDASSRSREA